MRSMAAVTATIWHGYGNWPSLFAPMPGAKPSASVRVLGQVDSRAGAREQLSVLMRAHGDAVYAYCSRVLRDPTLAADVLQQVFEQAYRDLATLREGRQARSWLFGIAYHRCLDAVKSRRRSEKRIVDEPGNLDETVSAEPPLSERVEARELSAALDECVSQLGEQARTAVLLRYHEGLTYERMSTICGEKPATLQARVTRALPLLRRCLEGKGVEL
jgi:RNA polymerase sigma factor (sigma-70 family)